MNEIVAYKCEYTGAVFEKPGDAVRSEFHALMRKAAGHLPAMGSINSRDIFEWLANNLEGNTYQPALGATLEALHYLLDHKETIASR